MRTKWPSSLRHQSSKRKVWGSIPGDGGVVFSERWKVAKKRERSGRKRKEQKGKRKGERTVKENKTFFLNFSAGISF